MAAVPRAAATVVLLRDGRGGLEAYLQRRPMGMGFAGGLWVFPGGRVDEADRDPAVEAAWAGPPAAEWADRLGLGIEEARGHVVAACRETLEEAGLLLATPPPGVAEVAAARRELLAGSAGLAELLARLGVRLDTGRLRSWGWWVTPEAEPRRYDTRFFLAGLPADAAVTAHLAEAERERWLPPVEAAADQRLPMLPPTRYTLRDLAGFGSVAEALAAAADRRVERVLPVLDGAELVMPWGERYPVPAPPPDATGPEAGGQDQQEAPRRPLGGGLVSDAWSPRVTRVLAPNPSPLTLEGTNTFVVAEPGAGTAVVIDPGPADQGHAQAVVRACGGRGVELVLLTHTHVDHAEGARAFADRVGAPLAALAPGWATPGAPDLAAGDPVAAAGLELWPLPTPGHAADHCCFELATERAVFTGDHVLGRGTTVVEWPSGDMADYLASLELLLRLHPERLYPGHGPLVTDAVARVEGYLAHRRDREAQVLAALAAGDRTPAEIVARVYAEVDPSLHPAAELSVRAHLAKLVHEGRVHTDPEGGRFTPA